VRLTASGTYAQAQVFDASGKSLGTFGAYSGLALLTLPGTGTYAVLVTSYWGYTGNYSLGLSIDGGCVQVQSMQITNQQAHMLILGEAGRNYRIDTSSNLTTWTTGQPIAFPNPYYDFVVSNITQQPRIFYRAVLVP